MCILYLRDRTRSVAAIPFNETSTQPEQLQNKWMNPILFCSYDFFSAKHLDCTKSCKKKRKNKSILLWTVLRPSAGIHAILCSAKNNNWHMLYIAYAYMRSIDKRHRSHTRKINCICWIRYSNWIFWLLYWYYSIEHWCPWKKISFINFERQQQKTETTQFLLHSNAVEFLLLEYVLWYQSVVQHHWSRPFFGVWCCVWACSELHCTVSKSLWHRQIFETSGVVPIRMCIWLQQTREKNLNCAILDDMQTNVLCIQSSMWQERYFWHRIYGIAYILEWSLPGQESSYVYLVFFWGWHCRCANIQQTNTMDNH